MMYLKTRLSIKKYFHHFNSDSKHFVFGNDKFNAFHSILTKVYVVCSQIIDNSNFDTYSQKNFYPDATFFFITKTT